MSGAAGAQRRGRDSFERLYAASADPWDYSTSEYERDKYAATLAALPPGPIDAALEVGCSIGVFTAQLAQRCGSVMGIDFSARALQLASARLAGSANVRLQRASFPEQAPAGPWDLVVCSEVLYYLDPPTLQSAVSWLTARLCAGACVVAVSWRGVGCDEPMLGDQVHDLLADALAPWHALDARHPGYRLDRFDGDRR